MTSLQALAFKKDDDKPSEEAFDKSGARSKSNEEFESTKRNSSTDGMSVGGGGAGIKLKSVRSRDIARDQLESSLSHVDVRRDHSAER